MTRTSPPACAIAGREAGRERQVAAEAPACASAGAGTQAHAARGGAVGARVAGDDADLASFTRPLCAPPTCEATAAVESSTSPDPSRPAPESTETLPPSAPVVLPASSTAVAVWQVAPDSDGRGAGAYAQAQVAAG